MPRHALTTADLYRPVDLRHVKGQEAAKRALEVAAAMEASLGKLEAEP